MGPSHGGFEDDLEATAVGEGTGDAVQPGQGTAPQRPLADSNWQVTERLLQTLNQELGEVKEYVLTELRGEIAALRSQKVQLQSEVQALQHQQDVLLSDRQQAQQQQWAQQFAQVMTQNLRQQIQTQIFGLSESGGTVRPEQRLMVLHQQMVGLEEGLSAAIQTLQQELGQHQSELSQQLLRMQDLEQQGELLLGALVQQLQVQQQAAQSFVAPSSQPAASRPLTEGNVDAIAFPNNPNNPAGESSSQGSSIGANPLAQNAGELSGELPGLDWTEPGLTGGASMAAAAVTAADEIRLPGHPTDVASVMAAMTGLKPPGEAGPGEAGPGEPVTAESLADAFAEESAPPWAGPDVPVPSSSSRAAAMPSPPRLTTPVPANPAALDIAADDGPDESFIADFPIDVVRPDVSGFPAAAVRAGGAAPSPAIAPNKSAPNESAKSGSVSFDVTSPGPAQGPSLDELYGAVGQTGTGDSVSASSPSTQSASGGIAMPPGMVDRGQVDNVEPPQPPAQPVSPWLGEPPTTISSLMELTDGTGRKRPAPVVNDGTTVISPSLSVSGAAGSGAAIAAPMAVDPLVQRAEAAVVEEELPRRIVDVQLRRSGAAIALVVLLLWAVQLGTVQVLFHGAPWIGDGQGFIAATWGSALVTFWIRMLMVLPFMIVIGQGLYPPLLPEMQAVFRDRDRIPLYSIAASGLFFFLAHFLLYGTIAGSSATPAVALFFLYPALGQLLGWSLFNQRLSAARLLAMVPLILGVLWLLVLWTGSGGRVAGLASGLCYALFLMLTAVNGRRMNPMTLTVLQFGLAWLWAVPAVFFLPRMVPSNDIGYVVACALLSATVGVSQLLGLASRRRLGAGLSAVLQGTLPLVVGVVCLFLTDEVLPISQVFGVLLVAGGAVALGFQRASREAVR